MSTPSTTALPAGERNQTNRSLFWSGGGYVITALINFGVLYVLAWFLPPSEMALIFVCVIFQDLILLFVENGMGSYIVQSDALNRREHASLFYQALLFGVLAGLGLHLAATPLGAFFHSPTLRQALDITALSFLPVVMAFPQRALLQRNMHFRRIAVAEFSGMLLGALLVLYLVFQGIGFQSYLYGFLVKKTVEALLLWGKDPWLPVPAFCPEQFRRLFRYSAFASNALVLSYGVRLVDTFIIGRFLGLHALGIYSLGSNLVFFPVSKCALTFSRVFISTFSQIRNHQEQLRLTFLEAFTKQAWLLLPALFGLFLFIPEIIRLFFTPQWLPAVVITQIMILNGLLVSFLRMGESLLLAVSRVRSILLIHGLGISLTAGLLIFLVTYGLEASAWAVNLASLISAILMSIALKSAIGFSWGEALRQCRVILLSLGAMLILATLSKYYLSPSLPAIPGLLVSVALATGAYLGTWRFLKSKSAQAASAKLTPQIETR